MRKFLILPFALCYLLCVAKANDQMRDWTLRPLTKGQAFCYGPFVMLKKTWLVEDDTDQNGQPSGMTKGQAFSQNLSCSLAPAMVVLPHEKGALAG